MSILMKGVSFNPNKGRYPDTWATKLNLQKMTITEISQSQKDK